MKTTLFFLTGCLAALAPTATFARIERVVEKTFTVQPGGTFKAETQGGSIRVQPGADQTVTVVAKQKIRASTDAEADDLLKDLDLTIEQQGDTVVAIAKYARPAMGFRFGSWPPVHVDFIVTVPSRTDAELRTSGGDIVVGDLTGKVLARTSGGDVKIGQIAGTVDAGTSGGNVKLVSCTGDTKLHTSGGNVTAERIVGRGNLHTSGGNIHVKLIENALQAHTSGGSVEAAIGGSLKDDCTLGTSGGNVRVTVDKAAAFQLDASTSGGGVHAAGLTITLEKGGVGKTRLVGKVNGGGPLLKLRTSGGSIEVQPR
ncbi:MAG: DUF4097 family beta strand repeat protein [Opitutae bacterium]|nr:DUF4097 family beta strand repeat protein [Opitutae bacterium]